MDERERTERAQLIQAAVESWADGCDHTHDDPEDCEDCTVEMMRRVANAAGLSSDQEAEIRSQLQPLDVDVAEDLIATLRGMETD